MVSIYNNNKSNYQNECRGPQNRTFMGTAVYKIQVIDCKQDVVNKTRELKMEKYRTWIGLVRWNLDCYIQGEEILQENSSENELW